MKFFAILIVILLQHFKSVNLSGLDKFFLAWSNFIYGRISKYTKTWVPLVITLGVPALCVMLIAHVLGLYWLSIPKVFIYAVVLLYSLRFVDLTLLIHKYIDQWRRSDFQAASYTLEQIAALNPADVNFGKIPSNAEMNIDTLCTMHNQVRTALLYRRFGDLFAVLFWFAISPICALLYRLIFVLHNYALLNYQASTHGGSVFNPALLARILWILEWLPLRLLALSICLAQSIEQIVPFLKDLAYSAKTDTFSYIQTTVMEATTAEAVTTRCGDTSISRSKIIGELALELEELAQVLSKITASWVAGIALLSVLFF